jgi:DNA polymerase-3 subunit gamma/tau
VRAGGGSVRDTLSVLDQLIAGATADGVDYTTAVALLGYTDDSLLGDVVDAFSAGDGAGVFRVIDRVIESGHDPRRFVEDLLERFRDLFVISAAQESAAAFLPEVPQDRLERLKGQARAYGPAELSRAADLLNAGLTEMSGATSPRLQLELICARILLPGSEDSRRSVVSRVDRLERRVGMSADGRMPAGAVPPAAVEAPAAQQQAQQPAAPATGGPGTAAGRGAHATGQGASAPGAAAPPGPPADEDPFAGVADAMASARSVLDEGPRGRGSQRQPAPESQGQPAPELQGQPEHAQSNRSEPPVHAQPEPPAQTGPPAAQDRPPQQGGPAQPEPHRQSDQWSAEESQQDRPAPPAQPGEQAPPERRDQPVQQPQQAQQPQPTSQEQSAPSAAPDQQAQAQARQAQQSATPQTQQSQSQPEPQQSRPSQPEPQYGEAHASPEIRQAPGEGAEIDAIRRGWPDVLVRLQQLRKLSYAIVSGNAFPQQFADGVLSLGFSNPGSVQAFRRGPHAQFVSTAVEQSLGIRAQVEVGDENAGPPPAQPDASGPSAAAGTPRGSQVAPGGSDGAGGPGPSGGPHAVTREQLDSVVGPREADREPVDHDRFWQSDAASDREHHDDAEGDSPQPVTGMEASDPGSAAPTSVTSDPAGHTPVSSASVADAPATTTDVPAPAPPTETTASVASAPVEDPWARPSDLPSWSTETGESPVVPEPAEPADASQAEDPVRSVQSTDLPIDAADPSSDSAPADPFAPGPEPVETSAGDGAVDFGAVVVPPPVDIEPYPDDEPYPTDEFHPSDEPYPTEDPYRGDDGSPAGDPWSADGTRQTQEPVADGGGPARGAPVEAGPPADLDFLGAYADVDIAFTDNPGQGTSTGPGNGPGRGSSPGLGDPSDDGPLGRYARLAQRHSGDVAPGAAAQPPPVQEHVPDPVENYADYDTSGDADIQQSTEFGPAVVERILGGVIIEEFDE